MKCAMTLMGKFPSMRMRRPIRPLPAYEDRAHRRRTQRRRLPGAARRTARINEPRKPYISVRSRATFTDAATGACIRQVTDHPSIHHHPFFFVPAWDDDSMTRLIFVSHRSGRPEIFAEEQRQRQAASNSRTASGIAEYSIYPSHDGRYVYFTAGAGAYPRPYRDAARRADSST